MTISGKELSDRLKAQMAEQVKDFPGKFGRAPHLAVILVGEDPASQTYVRNKSKACDTVGIKNTTILLPEETSQEEVLSTISRLNADEGVDGILVQLPLPQHISEQKVIDAIAHEKDVDGFHTWNVAALWRKAGTAAGAFTVPCTPDGVIRMIKSAGVQIDGKRAVVVGRSNIVGLPVAKLLLNENATVTICHSHTRDLASVTREADILVAATGRAKFITADMVKDGATVIDVGINRDPATGKLCGDVDFENVAPKCAWISPVPGGVGPMTICCLMSNTIDCFLRKQKI